MILLWLINLLTKCRAQESASFAEKADVFLKPIIEEIRTMSDNVKSLQTEVTGLRDDLTAATARVKAHEDARDAADKLQQQAIDTLQQQVDALKASPGDTTDIENSLQVVIQQVQEARQVAQNIDAGSTA